MCALMRKDSALSRRIKSLEKELSVVNGEIKTLAKVVRHAEHAGVSPALPQAAVQREVEPQYEPVPVPQDVRQKAQVYPSTSMAPAGQSVRSPAVNDYSQQSRAQAEARALAEQAAKKQVSDRDAITRDGRFATYLMSRDFHDVRPLRHEKHIQRNKAVIMSVIAVFLFLWMIYKFF